MLAQARPTMLAFRLVLLASRASLCREFNGGNFCCLYVRAKNICRFTAETNICAKFVSAVKRQMVMIAPCGARRRKSLVAEGRYMVLSCVRLTLKCKDTPASSLGEQRKRGSIAVSKRSKEGDERFFPYNALGLSIRIVVLVHHNVPL